jgi:hypothetical protein
MPGAKKEKREKEQEQEKEMSFHHYLATDKSFESAKTESDRKIDRIHHPQLS